MPSLSPLSEASETLASLAEGTETLSAAAEGAETLTELDELTSVSYALYPGSATYPSSTAYPGSYSAGLILASLSEATETLTPLLEI